MNLYEFTFIAQQSLLQQEVEEMVQELGLLLRNIKVDIVFRQIKKILKEEVNGKFTKQNPEVYTKSIQEDLVNYSNLFEDFNKILLVKLEEDLSNLKEIELKIKKEFNERLKGLEVAQDFVRIMNNSNKITKWAFIRNTMNLLKRNLSEYLMKLFHVILEGSNFISSNQLSKSLETLLNKVEVSGLVRYEYWGLLDFAYPINKMKSGHYCMMCISSTSSIMEEFIRRVKLNENIIRHLSVRVNNFFEANSHIKEADEQSS